MTTTQDDLVRRLRKAADTAASGGGEWYQLIHRCREAADRISSLTREIDQLTEERDEHHGARIINASALETWKARASLAEQQRDEAQLERDQFYQARELLTKDYEEQRARADLATQQRDEARRAFLAYVRKENGCTPDDTRCVDWNSEKCGCALEARAALKETK